MRNTYYASCNISKFTRVSRIAPITACCFVLFLTGCMEEKVTDVVLIDEISATLPQVDVGVPSSATVTIDIRPVVDDILSEKGHSERKIKSVTVVGATYGCLNLQGSHDWIVSGQLQARRTDGSSPGPLVPILDYTDVSVQTLLDDRAPAPLTSAGVDMIHEAMRDYLDGGSPILEFQMGSNGANPSPNAQDPMVFDWKIWLAVQVVVEYGVTLPDPF